MIIVPKFYSHINLLLTTINGRFTLICHTSYWLAGMLAVVKSHTKEVFLRCSAKII